MSPTSDSMCFEPCSGFRPVADLAADLLVCDCGWLEDDHPEFLAAPVPLPLVRRRRARRTVAMPERRAS
jgi:hypothetical protein